MTVMPLASGLRVHLTLFQPSGADYAHHITDCPPGFENLTASLYDHRITLLAAPGFSDLPTALYIFNVTCHL